MLQKTKISGTIWNWYGYCGYLIRSDQPLNSQNNVLVMCLPGQGQLSTDVTLLDQVVPANTFNAGKLPEKTADGKFITYVVPEFPHWVNISDVQAWVDIILPKLNIPYAKIGMYGLSLGGLGIGYFNQTKTQKHFDFAFFNDGLMTNVDANEVANIVNNVDAITFVSDDFDTTVPEIANSLNVYNLIRSQFPNFPTVFVHLPGAAHDTWDHSFDINNTNPDSFFTFLNKMSVKGMVPLPIPPITIIPTPTPIPVPAPIVTPIVNSVFVNIGISGRQQVPASNKDTLGNLWNSMHSFATGVNQNLLDTQGKDSGINIAITDNEINWNAPLYTFDSGPTVQVGSIPAWVTAANGAIHNLVKIKFTGSFKGNVEFWGSRIGSPTDYRRINIDGTDYYDAINNMNEKNAAILQYRDGHEFVFKTSVGSTYSSISFVKLIPA